MPRIHRMQHWCSMSDPAMEDALFEFTFIRLFADLSLYNPIPDQTTIMELQRLIREIQTLASTF